MSGRRARRLRPTGGAALLPGVAAAVLALAGCQATVRHKVEPIHITLDVNLKVDRELEEFFDFEREIEQEVLGSEAAGAADQGGAG